MINGILYDPTGFPAGFDWHNDQFPPLDALAYWHYLKSCNLIIEVGCGYSTFLARESGKNVIAIDPSPRVRYLGINYIRKKVQDVDRQIFKELKSGDILFIDSSHIYSKGSDVEHLIENIIPSLNPGVLVHFHDYFGENGYPESWKEMPEMKGWNENEHITRIKKKYHVLCEHHLISEQENEILKNQYPFVPTNIVANMGAVRGASIWLKI